MKVGPKVLVGVVGALQAPSQGGFIACVHMGMGTQMGLT